MFCLCTSSFTENYLQTTYIWIKQKSSENLYSGKKTLYTSYYKFNSRKLIRALSHSDSLCFKAFSQTIENVVPLPPHNDGFESSPAHPTHARASSKQHGKMEKLSLSPSLARARENVVRQIQCHLRRCCTAASCTVVKFSSGASSLVKTFQSNGTTTRACCLLLRGGGGASDSSPAT